MATWILLAALALLSGASGQFGICVEQCRPGGCPTGQACLSNGCGHTCQPVPTTGVSLEEFCPAVQPGMAGLCVEACGSFSWGGQWALQRFGSCPAGQACCSNGCGHSCVTVQQQRVIPAKKDLSSILQNLPDIDFPMVCALYCPCGYSGPCSCKSCTDLFQPIGELDLENLPVQPVLS